MGLCICSFNVVTTYNDQRVVEPEIFDAIERELDRQFDGYTDEGRKPGCWHGQKEVSAWYSVYCEPERIWVLRDIINQIGLKLGQAQIALQISPATAELINIKPEQPSDVVVPAESANKSKKKKEQDRKIALWNKEDGK